MIHLARLRSNDKAFVDYLRIKHEVFVNEQAWPLPVDRESAMVKPDEFDPVSFFVLASSDRHEAVGVIRATRLIAAIPRLDLIGRYFHNPEFGLGCAACATINSLAVLPRWRGVRGPIGGSTLQMTSGKALVCEIVDWLREEGCKAILLTTARAVSAVFFEHLGFFVLDASVTIGQMGANFMNMGCVVNDHRRFAHTGSPLLAKCPLRPLDDSEEACRTFMEKQHHRVLQGASIEEYVFNCPRQEPQAWPRLLP